MDARALPRSREIYAVAFSHANATDFWRRTRATGRYVRAGACTTRNRQTEWSVGHVAHSPTWSLSFGFSTENETRLSVTGVVNENGKGLCSRPVIHRPFNPFGNSIEPTCSGNKCPHRHVAGPTFPRARARARTRVLYRRRLRTTGERRGTRTGGVVPVGRGEGWFWTKPPSKYSRVWKEKKYIYIYIDFETFERSAKKRDWRRTASFEYPPRNWCYGWTSNLSDLWFSLRFKRFHHK